MGKVQYSASATVEWKSYRTRARARAGPGSGGTYREYSEVTALLDHHTVLSQESLLPLDTNKIGVKYERKGLYPLAGELWTKPSTSEFKTVDLFLPIEFKWISFLCDSRLCL